MRILILGGTGIISAGIVPLLQSRGDVVTLFNRGVTDNPFAGQVEAVRGSRQSVADLAAQAARGFDAVIDMICYTPHDAQGAIEAFAGAVTQYVMCSTIDVYAAPAHRYPITEDHPRAPSAAFRYAFDKARAEEALRAAEAQGAFGLTVLRPAATYVRGIVAPIGNAALYLDLLRRGRPLIMHGDGSSIWGATHRDDVARAFAGALANPAAVGGSYNVAGDEFLTWETYWRVAADAIGAPEPRFVHIPTDVIVRALPDLGEWCALNFQYHNLIDSSAARRDLGFAPAIPWAEGAKALRDLAPSPDPAHVARYEALLAWWERAMATP